MDDRVERELAERLCQLIRTATPAEDRPDDAAADVRLHERLATVLGRLEGPGAVDDVPVVLGDPAPSGAAAAIG